MYKFNKLLHLPYAKYILAGGSAFIIDYLVLNGLYYLLDVELVVATTLGFVAGLIVSFSLNRVWVFSSRSRPVTKQLVYYIILLAYNYLFTTVTISILNTLHIGPALSKILAMGLITVWNYWIFKKLIFK